MIQTQTASTEQLTLLGGIPVRQQPYPKWPVVDERDIEAVTAVIQSGRWGGAPYPGTQTKKFTERFAAMQGGGFAVAMVNGTVTMEVALRTADIGWGDEVIVPAYTFQATAAAPMAAGAIPVIVDIDPQTYCIDPKAVEAAITEKTRAIIPVHLGAQMADMDAIMDIANRHNLVVIEDCAHAHGARWNGKGAGTIGHFGSFSFQSSKSMTTGEGGILLCRSEEDAHKAHCIVNCGRLPAVESEENASSANPMDMLMKEVAKFVSPSQVNTFGSNYRMTEIQAALGNVALERFPEQIAQREAMIDYLEENLSQVPGVRILKQDERYTRKSLYRYIFAVKPEIFGAEHDEVCLALYAEGIPCWNGYPAMHHYDLFQPKLSKLPVPSAFPEYFDFESKSFPEAERACEHEAVWLDESVFRAGKQGIDDVVKALKKIQNNTPALKVAKAQFVQAAMKNSTIM